MKIETPILRRLGPVPFWRGEKRCLDALERIYRRASEKAALAIAGGAEAVYVPSRPTSRPRAPRRTRNT